MKKLIVDAFKDILNLEVRVINLPDEDIDMAIYVIHDKKHHKMSENDLGLISYDYAITHAGSNYDKWVYLRLINIDAVIRNNELISPPDVDYTESVKIFLEAEDALKALIITNVEAKFNDLLMCREEMNEV